jgi:hypothetical protein
MLCVSARPSAAGTDSGKPKPMMEPRDMDTSE